MKFFLDTYALIEISQGNKNYQKYLEEDTVTLKDNLAELYYFLLKNYNVKTADFFLNKFIKIVAEFPVEIISKSMIFKIHYKDKKFSYIDCLGYTYALMNKRLFLTGDRAFQNLENVDLVR